MGIKYKNNLNVGTGSVGYEADATSAAPLDSVDGGRIVKSEGRTVKWNQLVVNGDFADFSNWSRSLCEYIVSNNVCTFTVTARYGRIYQNIGNVLVSGHKYYLSVYIKPTTANPDLSFFVGKNNYENYQNFVIRPSTLLNDTSVFTKVAAVKTLSETPSESSHVCIMDRRDSGWNAIQFKNVQVFDLTSIFGAGNEPTTVEAFESWLAENMVEQDYYAYDAGSLVPVTVKGVKRDVGGTTVTNPMPVTTLKDENDVVMFPDGLKSAGSVKDEIDWEHGVAVKRVGVVDLGDLTWSNLTTLEGWDRFNAAISDAASAQNNKAFNAISPKLNMRSVTAANDDPHLWDAAFWNVNNTTKILVYTPSGTYASTTAFKTAMSGVLLYYELATPITYHFATHTELKKRIVKIGESVEVDGIEGETVVWNQMFDTITKETTTTDWGSYKIENGVITLTHGDISNNINVQFLPNGYMSFISGHKYYINGSVGGTTASSGTHRIWIHSSSAFPIGHRLFSYDGGLILDALADESLSTNLISVQCLADETSGTYVFTPQLFDLTQMFGSGNEPATVAEFEAWLSAHGGIKDYYPYCAGELKDKEKGNVRGVGFNLWDEEWEAGGINENGEKISAANRIRSKNAIRVFGNTTYAVTQLIYLAEFDSAMNLVKARYSTEVTFTTMASTQYILFMSKVNYGETYANDICINLSDASRNGTYVPYKSITRSVDLTTLKGKVDGAGEDVVMFPDGMRQAGSVKDEIFVEGGVVKAVKRVESVDLGELTWVYDSTSGTYPVFYAYITDLSTNGSKLICEKYIKIDGLNWYDFINNDQNGKIGAPSSNRPYVIIQDSAYTSASDFTTAMQGVMLNYELASPVTYVVNMQGMEMADVRKVMVGAQKVYDNKV